MNQLRYFILALFLLLGIDSFSQLNHKYFIMMGRIDLSEENYSDAMYNFNKAITAKPNDFEGYFLRGIAKYSLNDYIGAVNDFTKTLELHPLYVRAYHYRGIANDRLGNYANAKKDYLKAISLDPYDAELYIAMGSTKLHLNEFESAIASFDTAIIMNDYLLVFPFNIIVSIGKRAYPILRTCCSNFCPYPAIIPFIVTTLSKVHFRTASVKCLPFTDDQLIFPIRRRNDRFGQVFFSNYAESSPNRCCWNDQRNSDQETQYNHP